MGHSCSLLYQPLFHGAVSYHEEMRLGGSSLYPPGRINKEMRPLDLFEPSHKAHERDLLREPQLPSDALPMTGKSPNIYPIVDGNHLFLIADPTSKVYPALVLGDG